MLGRGGAPHLSWHVFCTLNRNTALVPCTTPTAGQLLGKLLGRPSTLGRPLDLPLPVESSPPLRASQLQAPHGTVGVLDA